MQEFDTPAGGVISIGESTVLIGTGGSGASATMAVSSIPFPDISFVSKVLASVVGQGDSLAQAQANQEQIRKEAEEYEPDPVILRAEFFDEETDAKISETDMIETVKMRVYTRNIPDGGTVTINLSRVKIKDKDGKKVEDEEVVTLTGTVNGDVAIVEYEVPDYTNDNEQN